MRKVVLAVLSGFAAVLLFAACSKGGGDEANFNARILEMHENSVLVEPLNGENIRRSSDKISFSTKGLDDIGASVGDTVTVTYTGGVMESYPAQIRAVSWSMYQKASPGASKALLPAGDVRYVRMNAPSGIPYPYLVAVASRTELEQYAEAFGGPGGQTDPAGWLDPAGKYGEEWFKEHTLWIAALMEGSGSVRHEVQGIAVEARAGGADAGYIVVKSIRPEIGTCDMAYWYLLVGADRDTGIGGLQTGEGAQPKDCPVYTVFEAIRERGPKA